jgi:3-oxoadipate enol-lactonase
MREFWFYGDGVRLYAVEEGHGPAMVMLHGGGGDHHAVLPIAMPLAGRYRVIASDQRSSGKSWYGDSLTWDRLADDLEALLKHLGLERAVIGGISMGTGVALRFARRHSRRAAALLLISPVYAGGDKGFTENQAGIFRSLEPCIERARTEGFEAFRSLYQQRGIEQYFNAMIASADLPSYLATNRFMACGVQPFASSADLAALAMPTLLVPGNDPMHPPEVADLYAATIPNCTVADLPASLDIDTRNLKISEAIGDFCA